MKIIIVSLLGALLAQGNTCLEDMKAIATPLQAIQMNPKDITIVYRRKIFSGHPQLEIRHLGKPVLSFSTKKYAVHTLVSDVSYAEFATVRKGFANMYEHLAYGLWLKRKAKLPVQLDLSQLLQTASFGPGCSVDLNHAKNMILQVGQMNHFKRPLANEPQVLEPELNSKEAPDRSIQNEARGFPVVPSPEQPVQ